MKIINENPPNIEAIQTKFKLHKGVIFTYGDIIYNPDKGEIDEFILCHEQKHCEQQGDKPNEWWNKYLIDPEFRIKQETEAYGEQYKFIKDKIKEKKIVNIMLERLAGTLCGEIYGNVLTFNEAKCKIRNYAKCKSQ
jgi:hypothetical protein